MVCGNCPKCKAQMEEQPGYFGSQCVCPECGHKEKAPKSKQATENKPGMVYNK